MWIALGIIGGLAALITVILLLPVRVIIKNDENNELLLRGKLLWMTFGEDPDPDNAVVKLLKKLGGVDRLEAKQLKQSVKTQGAQDTLAETCTILLDILKQVVVLLRYCTATKLQIQVLCAGEDPAQTALCYGKRCALVYNLVAAINSVVRFGRRACQVNVGCDDKLDRETLHYHVELRVRLNHAVAAFWRLAYAEAKRTSAQKDAQQK